MRSRRPTRKARALRLPQFRARSVCHDTAPRVPRATRSYATPREGGTEEERKRERHFLYLNLANTMIVSAISHATVRRDIVVFNGAIMSAPDTSRKRTQPKGITCSSRWTPLREFYAVESRLSLATPRRPSFRISIRVITQLHVYWKSRLKLYPESLFHFSMQSGTFYRHSHVSSLIKNNR